MAKVKAVKPARLREYLTITHAMVKERNPCDMQLRLFYRTFPYREFGVRGVPVTLANAVRMLDANLPASWVLHHFTHRDVCPPFGPSGRYREGASYNHVTDRFPSTRQKAALFVKLLHEHASAYVCRFTAPSKLTSLKGAKLVKAA